MDLATIREFIKRNGDTFILIENGHPELVMMPFQEYEKIFRQQTVAAPSAVQSMPSRRPIADGREPVENRPLSGLGAGTDFMPREHDGAPLWQGGPLRETEFIPPSPAQLTDLPARTEDIRLEDLPI